jgi:hypothetical protein
MENYINIIFNKKVTFKTIEETVGIVGSTSRVLLSENELEYEIFKENNSQGITVPLAKSLNEQEIVEFVNEVADKLFDAGYNSFDIEVGLNERERLTTFEPWRDEIEAAGYTITPSGTNIKARDGGTVAGINDNGNLWSGSRTITDIVRGNSTASSAPATNAPERSFGTFNQDGTVQGPGQAARPGARPAPTPTQASVRMSDEEAEAEFIRLLRARDYAAALRIADDYPSIRDRIEDSNYQELRRLASAAPVQSAPTDGDTQPTTPGDSENQYAREGDVVVGRDTNIKDDGRTNVLDWTLNIANRTITFTNLRPNRQYERIFLRTEGNREFLSGVRNGQNITIREPLENLIAAIKEYVDNYQTRPNPPASATATQPAPNAQTDVEQPETPEIPADSGVTVTGDDNTDIPTLQAALGDPVTLEPPLDPGETSDITGIKNPVRYGTNMISGMPDIIYNAIDRVASNLSERNALAFRDTLNYDLLSRDQVQSIIRELERAYPVVEIARAIRENDLPQDQKDALIVLLEVRQELNRFLEGGRTTTAPTNDTAPTVDTDNEEPPAQTRSDGGLSIAREARSITTEIYTNLGSPTTGANTGEREIQAALQRIENETMWNTVAGTYAQRYPSTRRNNLRTGELLGDLRGALSRRDWRRYVAPELERLGIEEEYDAPAETNESLNAMKINDIVDEETYDGDDFYEAYGDLWFNEDEIIDEAEYQGRKVKLGKPMQGDVKKFKVYVKNPKGNVVKVNFGDPDMKIKKSNPARRRSFRARHNCDNPGPRHKARYWSCRKW